jgi:hypothetical protein
MTRLAAFFRLSFLCILGLLPQLAGADSWAAPKTTVTLSRDGGYRVTIEPKSWGAPAGRNEAPEKALARVERLDAGKWRLVWQKHLLNELAPTRALLADKAAYLVTFDNWGNAGWGPNVVVIYDGHGKLVRHLSLEQILPAGYVRNLPRSVSSRWWGGEHRLVDGDSVVELQVVEPGTQSSYDPHSSHVPVHIRLADGVVLPYGGPAWQRALTKIAALDRERQARWEAFRRMRTSPLPAPSARDTLSWNQYRAELGARIFGEAFGGIVLAAPGDRLGHDTDEVSSWIEEWKLGPPNYRNFIFLSPDSDRLADVLVAALRKRSPNSMNGLHLVFVGTSAEGKRVSEAAARAGARLTWVDRSKPYPPGTPLPATPPEYFL